MSAQNSRAQSSTECLNTEYVTSIYGIFKLCQLVFSICCLVSSSIGNADSNPLGGAAIYIQFISILSFILSITFYYLHAFRGDEGWSGSFPAIFSEMSFSILMVLCYLVAGIIAAIYINHVFLIRYMVSCTFFSWSCFLVYLMDFIVLSIKWRQSTEGPYFLKSIFGGSYQ